MIVKLLLLTIPNLNTKIAIHTVQKCCCQSKLGLSKAGSRKKFRDLDIESIADSVQSINFLKRGGGKGESAAIGKIDAIKSGREEEEQVTRQKQVQFEKAQVRLENLRFTLETKLQTGCLDYHRFIYRHFKTIKTKVQDSYYVACVPAIIDSIVFEEDLKNRGVSLLTESFTKKMLPYTNKN